MSDFLKITPNGQILEIVLDRPKANALDAPASREMGKVFADFRDDPELRVAILTGAGEKFFSGGWDLNAVAEGEEYLGDFGEGGFGGFPEMTDLLKPVICAVNGLAVGAGFEMLLRADFIIAAEHAQFMLPEVRIGVAPDVGTFMLPKLLPRQKALEILMSGRRFGAAELAAFGLVNEVVPADQLMERARALAEDLLPRRTACPGGDQGSGSPDGETDLRRKLRSSALQILAGVHEDAGKQRFPGGRQSLCREERA